MKHKLFTLLLAMIASVGTMFASNTSVDGIWYDFDSSTQTATVTYHGDSYDSYANEYSGSVTIPSSVTYNEMTYSVTTIGENAFQYCTELTSVTIPNSVTYIAWAAISDCTGLTSVEIPNGVIWIGHYAFDGCTGLTSVTIPNSVKSVGHGAFRNCFSLTSVTIPSSVTDIKSEAFANCTSLSDINIESGNLNYCSVDGIVFNKEKTSIICYPAGKTNTEYNIPNNITSIEDDAFVGCRSLTSVNIPNSVTSIGSGAFQFCTSLTSVEIPNSVTYLGGYSFYGCKGLTSVAIPNSIISIGNYTFYGCVGLNSIIIPSDVTSIGKGALSSCTTLTSVTNYAMTPQTINANVFNNITISELTLYVPEESVEAYKAADVWKDFGNILPIEETPEPCIVASGTCGAQVDNLTWTLTCDSVLTISGTGEMGDFADTYYVPWYNERFSIKTIIVEQGVTSIGKWSFGNCVNVTSVTLPSSITNIGNWAFGGCQMESLIIPNSVSSIGNYAFYTCGALKNLTLPSNLISIGNYAFCACENLGLIEIPDKVASIGEGAFRYCSGLTSVTIPNSVTSIGDGAFDGCSNLTTITNYATIPQPLDPDGISVFGGVPLACTLYVPAESIALYQAADVWKDFYNILPIDSTEKFHYATLADIYNMAADSTFTLGAFDVMYVPDFQSGSNMYIKDSTGSCVIYKVNYGLQAGDHVEAGLQGKVSIYNGLHEVIPITAKEDLIITHGEAPAPMVATEVPSLNNASQYVVYEGVSFTTDTAFVEGRRHTVYGSWNGQTITFYNQYYIGATLSANKTYNITAVNTIYQTTPEAYPLAVEEVSPAPCIIASGTCGAQGDNLTWTLTCDSVLTISGTGEMADYEWNVSPFFSNLSISSVVIDDGVTSIGEYIFNHCSNIKEVVIPNSVTTIGFGAFHLCTSLVTIEIPDSVTSIGEISFSNCISLTAVTIGSNVTRIEGWAFENNNSLISFTSYCTTPPTIDSNRPAFVGSYLSTCTLYVPAESVEAYQTANGWGVFGNILAIEDEPAPCIIASGTCGAQGDNLTWTLTCDSVLTISGTGAMEDYSSGKSPWYSNIISIKSVVFEEGVTSIGKWAFEDCSSLTSIVIPNSVISIGYQTFRHCSSLTSIEIPNSVTSIGGWAFYGCSSLTSVTIPRNVTSIGYGLFASCSGLTAINVASNNPEYCSIDGILFNKGQTILIQYPGAKQGAYMIPNSVTIIGDGAFSHCSGLTSVTIPNSVTNIGSEAFHTCSSLTAIKIPNSVTSIGSYAFCNCTGLTSVTIPNSVTGIGGGAFRYCTGLSSIINYASTPQTITASVFNNVNKSTCTLYVPAESLAAYQAADVWKEFGNILPIGESGEVEVLSIAEAIQIGMALDSMATSAETYTIEGYVINAGTFYAGAKYQNWYMADDQETSSSDFQAYKCYPIDGIDTVEVRNGSKVRMTGHLQKYYDRQKALYVVEMTYTPAIILSKPQIDTITVAEALALGAELEDNASTSKQYAIRGYVSSFSPYYEQLGDQNFYIADDPNSTANTNAAGGFYVYRGIPSTGSAVNKGDLVELTCAIRKYVPASGTNIKIENSEFPVAVTVLQTASDTCIVASGTCGAQGDNLTWMLSCDSVLTISGTGAMENYSSNSNWPWYSYRKSITSVVVEDGVTSLGSFAFDYLVNVTSITLPNTVTQIGWYSIGHCYKLTSITIPASVTYISGYAFSYCEKLTAFNVDQNNSYYSSVDGVLFNKDQTQIISYPIGKEGTHYTIPNTVVSIYDGAFASTKLESIDMPNGIIEIGGWAFSHCMGLTSIVLPDQVSYIGTYAFSYCRNLESVTIPMSVTNIANGAFIACDNLKTVTNYSTIPQRVDSACFSYFRGGYYITTSTLYVPAQSVAAYQAADVWKDFGNILPIEGDLPVGPTEGEFNVLYVGQDGDSISSEPVMLHLPVAPEIAGFTFLKWQVVAGDLEEGIIIQAVYQADESTSASSVYTNPANPAQKLIRNGNVYILSNEKTYSITGQEVK